MEFTVCIQYSTRRKIVFKEMKFSKPDNFPDLMFNGSFFFAARSVMGEALLAFLVFNGSRNVRILQLQCSYRCGVLSDCFTETFVT